METKVTEITDELGGKWQAEFIFERYAIVKNALEKYWIMYLTRFVYKRDGINSKEWLLGTHAPQYDTFDNAILDLFRVLNKRNAKTRI